MLLVSCCISNIVSILKVNTIKLINLIFKERKTTAVSWMVHPFAKSMLDSRLRLHKDEAIRGGSI